MNHRRILPLFLLALSAGPAWADTAQKTIGNVSGTMEQRLQSAFGLIVLTLLCAGYSQIKKPRPKIPWHTAFWGLAIQFVFALMVLRSPWGQSMFDYMNAGVDALIRYSKEGAAFIFGSLTDRNVNVGTPLPGPPAAFADIRNSGQVAQIGAGFAFNVLPTIIVFSALSTLLYHSGIMGYVVGSIAWVMQRTMKTSGAETLASAANIFLGQTEAPLLVKPFLPTSTKSELMAVMTGGFANIASGVLAVYVGMLAGFVPNIAGHLISASLISAPSSLLIAKLLIPESEEPETGGKISFKLEKIDANAVDAAARGASEGAGLAFNVAAMLIAFTALVALANGIIGMVGGYFQHPELNLQQILGIILSPIAWLIGCPWKDCMQVGSLLGIKTTLNEFVAYFNMKGSLTNDVHFIDGRSVILASYALCGFANFSSIAIQVSGISVLAPTRRAELAKIGFLAMIGGATSSLMAACVVGILL